MSTTTTEPWAPDIRWALPVIGAAWIWTGGWLPIWSSRAGSPFSPWLMIAFAVLLALVGVWRARAVWTVTEFGESLREQGSLLAVVVGVCAGGWLVLAGHTSPFAQLPLLIVGAALCGGWFAALVSVAPRHAAEQSARSARIAEQTEHEAIREILDESQCGDVKVFGYDNTRAGFSVELGPDPAYPHRPTYDHVLARLAALTLNLAIYWRAKDGTVLDEQDVRLESIAADRWLLHVSTAHVLRETVTYHMSDMPESFNAMIQLGVFEDGAAMRLGLCGKHMKVVGVTGGGKSVIINNIIGRTLECRSVATESEPIRRPDALVWICAVEKLVPLVFPWLQPWFNGETTRPVLDMVKGEDPDDVAAFLRALYRLARSRNQRLTRRSKHRATPTMPAIVAIMEEAKVLTSRGIMVDMSAEIGPDVWWDVSKLLSETAALCRTAAMSLIMVTQQGLYDGLGTHGDELMRNLSIRACTVTETESDGRMSLPKLPGSVDTTMLRDYSMYLQVGLGDTSRAMPGKAGHLDEERVVPVALAMSSALATLGPRDVAALGHDYYYSRWDRDQCATLVRACESDDDETGWVGRPWPMVGALPYAAQERQPQHPSDGDEPVHTPPNDAPNNDADVVWLPEWDDELAAILGEPVTEPPVAGKFGLPGDDDIARIERLAAQVEREADEQIAARDAAAPTVPTLPQPLRAVIAYLDRIDDAPEWIPTAELAGAVLGDDVDNASVKLGRALARNSATLRSTEPRDLPTGGRGRGYMVADLYRAAVAIRDGAAE